MKKLPYEHTDEIQAILNSDKTITQKANDIYEFDFMIARMADRGIPRAQMSRNQIVDILIERER